MISLGFLIIGIAIVILGSIFSYLAYKDKMPVGLKLLSITLPMFGVFFILRGVLDGEHLLIKVFILIIISMLVSSITVLSYDRLKK